MTVAALVVLASVVTAIVVFVQIPFATQATTPPDSQLLSPTSGPLASDPGASGRSPTHGGTPGGSTANGSGKQFGSLTSYAVVVNKKHPLVPRTWEPTDLVAVHVPFIGVAPRLRAAAATGVEALFAAFEDETHEQMESTSAYRSYVDQKAEYTKFSAQLGSSAAAETTALPGYSEHQTGLAIDIGARGSSCQSRDCFAATTQARWLQQNAWRFGFIIRYPRGQEAVTGYTYEPWHIRYVGPALAVKIHGHSSSLEAYFHLPAAPNY